MQQQLLTDNRRLDDRADRYGWISIALHWLVAVAVIVMWVIGKSIPAEPMEAADEQRKLHMSIGIALWLLIAFRIAWRVRSGHPHVPGLRDFTYRLAKITHYLLLAAISLMLLSGPLMAWANGATIPVFGWFGIPGPFEKSDGLRDILHAIHVASSNVLLWLTLLHVSGAFKHLMFHADDSFVRMLWPGKRTETD